MNVICVISLFTLLSISSAENSRLLQSSSCICPAIFDPVCCEGNIQYSSQCHANCKDAQYCQQGACDFACAATTCLVGTQCQAKEGGEIGEVECAQIPDWCETDSDCEIKNVGNCCGFYPGCVNKDYIPDPDAVKQWCQDNGMVSICGWTMPDGCTCIDNKCDEVFEPFEPIIPIETIETLPPIDLTIDPFPEPTPRPTTENCRLMDGWNLMGTPDTCPMILFICPDNFIPWFDDECGCGCKPNCESLPDGWVLYGKPEDCPLMDFICNEGYEHWFNDCGCGCKQIWNPCASTLCPIGTECIDNGDGTADCVELRKRRCGILRKCDDGYDCIIDPECTDNSSSYSRGNRVCAKTNGDCGGFVGATCPNPTDICQYPCSSSLGVCISYQYE